MTVETVKRLRQIPAAARILVSEGDVVDPSSVVARIEALPGRLLRISAAASIGVEPKDLQAHMVKNPGDHVTAGEAVAARSDFFDRRATRCSVDGLISAVSRNLGYVYVREIVDLGEGGGPVTLDVAKALNIAPRELDRFWSPGIKPGAVVAKGQVLASVDRGPRDNAVSACPFYGRIQEISLDEGTVTISPLFPSPDVTAYIRGRVTQVIPDHGIEVTGRAIRFEGTWGLGGEAHGSLQMVEGDLTSSFPAKRASILAVRGTASEEALLSAREAGAAGAVFGYMPSEVVLGLMGTHRNLGVTGDEDAPYPIVVMEGFHPQPMDDQVFSILREHEGLTISIRGITHIRAGVIRPEVIIPIGDQ